MILWRKAHKKNKLVMSANAIALLAACWLFFSMLSLRDVSVPVSYYPGHDINIQYKIALSPEKVSGMLSK